MKPRTFKAAFLQYWRLYLFLLIPLTYIVIFAYVPMAGVQIAFRKYNFVDGIWNSPWVGFDYFVKFFHSVQFKRVITNTLTVSIYSLVAGFPIPILFALMLNVINNQRYRKLVQTITYMPHFISIVVLIGMMNQLLHPKIGLVAAAVRIFGVEAIPNLTAMPAAFADLYVWSGIWQSMGWNSIIYISALATCDPELHEAMIIDGASRFQRVLNLDFPCILPTATILLILNTGGIMNVGFEKVMLMQNNMNISASEVISTYVYKIGLSGSATSDFSYATAIGLFNSIVNFTLLIIVNGIAKISGETSLW